MKSLSTNTLFGIALVAVVLSIFAIAQTTPKAGATSPSATVLSAATTSAATSITTSTRIMASTTNPLDGVNSYQRIYAVVCNPNTNPVWLNLDLDKATNLPAGAVTTVIAAAAGYNACFEITDRNLTQGSVTASSTNQTATTITVKQYVQPK